MSLALDDRNLKEVRQLGMFPESNALFCLNSVTQRTGVN